MLKKNSWSKYTMCWSLTLDLVCLFISWMTSWSGFELLLFLAWQLLLSASFSLEALDHVLHNAWKTISEVVKLERVGSFMGKMPPSEQDETFIMDIPVLWPQGPLKRCGRDEKESPQRTSECPEAPGDVLRSITVAATGNLVTARYKKMSEHYLDTVGRTVALLCI